MSTTALPARARVPSPGESNVSHLSTTTSLPAPASAPSPSSIASPGPLGLLSIALTTFLLSIINAGLVSPALQPVVFGELFAFGGIVLILCGMWAFRVGHIFGATAFTGYGAFFLSFWALFQFYIKEIPPAQVGKAIGLYLLAWALFTFVIFIASFKTNRVTNIVIGLLLLMLVVSGIGKTGGYVTLVHCGGYVGLVVALGTAYIACAELLAAMHGRSILPLKELS